MSELITKNIDWEYLYKVEKVVVLYKNRLLRFGFEYVALGYILNWNCPEIPLALDDG